MHTRHVGKLFSRCDWWPAALLTLLLAACGQSGSSASVPGGLLAGPALSVPQAALDESLSCIGEPARSTQPTVLLVHGTAETGALEWTWNYLPALTALDRTVCLIELPDAGMGDIQDSAEYLVAAIRKLHAQSGRRIQIVGHSQGGMIPRFALKYWPDTRAMVEDLVGLASSNHGTLESVVTCNLGCAPSFWQQATGSQFITALNEGGETFVGIDYSTIYTRLDEVVVPNLDEANGSSALRPASASVVNIATQDVCPGNAGEHLALGSYDPVAWALVQDALTNPGPADSARVPLTVCAELTMPGVDQASFVSDYGALLMFIADTVGSYPQVDAEPPLKCYVTKTC